MERLGRDLTLTRCTRPEPDSPPAAAWPSPSGAAVQWMPRSKRCEGRGARFAGRTTRFFLFLFFFKIWGPPPKFGATVWFSLVSLYTKLKQSGNDRDRVRTGFRGRTQAMPDPCRAAAGALMTWGNRKLESTVLWVGLFFFSGFLVFFVVAFSFFFVKVWWPLAYPSTAFQLFKLYPLSLPSIAVELPWELTESCAILFQMGIFWCAQCELGG